MTHVEHPKTALLRYRNSQKELADAIGNSDRNWSLCRRTGRSYSDLVAVAADVCGDWRRFQIELGYSPLTQSNLRYHDNGHWITILAWLRMYIPQWEARFRVAIKDIINVPNPEAILAAASEALNMAPEVLAHFANHNEELEIFFETQRRTLGNMAEAKLWQLVAEGDAATIRWLLPRIKTDVYGDNKVNKEVDNGPRTIKIIEQ